MQNEWKLWQNNLHEINWQQLELSKDSLFTALIAHIQDINKAVSIEDKENNNILLSMAFIIFDIVGQSKEIPFKIELQFKQNIFGQQIYKIEQEKLQSFQLNIAYQKLFEKKLSIQLKQHQLEIKVLQQKIQEQENIITNLTDKIDNLTQVEENKKINEEKGALLTEIDYKWLQNKSKIFDSQIVINPLHQRIILSLFKDTNTKFQKLFQAKKSPPDTAGFHNYCDNKGSTLVLIKPKKEKNSILGGMAVPSWHSNNKFSGDPLGEES